MELSQKQKEGLHEIISDWLRTQGIIDKEVDYEITVTQIRRKFVDLKIHRHSADLDVQLAVSVSDFLKGKKSSTRLNNILNNADFLDATLGKLVRISSRDFMRYRHAGKRTLAEIQELLGSESLSLDMTNVPIGPAEIAAITKREEEMALRWEQQRE